MGRTLLTEASIRELKSLLRECKKRKQELETYLQKLKLGYSAGKISYSKYFETLLKKTNGKTIKDWVIFYDEQIKNYEKEIKKKIIQRKIPVIIVSSILLILLITSIFYIQPKFIGFAVQTTNKQVQVFEEQVNIQTIQSTNYEFIPQTKGILSSLKISGNFEEINSESSIKIYLDDLLILDTQKTPQPGITGGTIGPAIDGFFSNFLKKFTITGLTVDDENPQDSSSSESPEISNSDSDNSNQEQNSNSASETQQDSQQENSESEASNSEENNEEVSETQESSEEDLSPSQEQTEEPPQTSETEEIIGEETNEDEELTETKEEQIEEEIEESKIEEPQDNKTSQEETPENFTEKDLPKKEPEKENFIEFKDFCGETCNLASLGLNKSSYTIKIEISNSKLSLNEIKYEIISEIKEEKPEFEIPENNTAEQETNTTEIPETNVTQSQTNTTLNYPIHTKTIPNIFIEKNNLKEINLNDYFSNAEQFFVLQIRGISTTISNSIIKFQPEQDFEGIRETTIIAENKYGQIESNSFNIIISGEGIIEQPTKEIQKEEIPFKSETNITTVKPEFDATKEINITEENVVITTTQYGAVLGQPVKWKKTLDPEQEGTAKIKIPKEADNIEIKKIKDQIEEDLTATAQVTSITGAVIGSPDQEGPITKFFKKLFSGLGTITGAIIGQPTEEQTVAQEIIEEKEVSIDIDDSESNYEIEYETPAPQITEEQPLTNRSGKRIKLTGPDTVHYENVLTFTTLDESLNITSPNKVRIKWVEQNQFINPLLIEDTDNNGIYDYIEFIAPQLSEATFDIEIVIVDAEHLNPARNFVANIYEYVNETDGVNYTIPKNHYARAYFEKNLTNENVIDVYVLNQESLPATIEVYEKDSNIVVGAISIIGPGVYATELNFEGSQDVFDLKSVGNDIIYDYIHDARTLTSVSMTANITTITEGDSITATGVYDSLGNGGAQAYVFGITEQNSGQNIDATCGAGDVFQVTATDTSSCTQAGGESCSADSNGIITASLKSTGHTIVWTLKSCSGSSALSPEDVTTYRVSGGAVSITHSTGSITINSPPEPDDEYPIFTSIVETPTNNSAYLSGNSYKFNSTITNTNTTAGVQINNINYSAIGTNGGVFNTSFISLSAGIHTYYWFAWGNGSNNNYNTTALRTYVIQNATPSATTTSSAGFSYVYGTETIIGSSESNEGDGGVVYEIFRDNVSIGTGETITLGAGSYHYKLNTTGGQNYSLTEDLDNDLLTVNKDGGLITLLVNHTGANATISAGQNVWLNATLTTGDPTTNIYLYNNGILINNGTSPISNLTTFSSEGSFNISAYYTGSQNYSENWSSSYWVDVGPTTNTAPQIYNLSYSDTINLNEGPSNTNISINFSATDAEGYGDLINSSAVLNLTRGGVISTDTNCVQTIASGNSANYSCEVMAWWWYDAGPLNITAHIEDASSEFAQNNTMTSTINSLTGFETVTTISFSGINAGSTNTTANTIIVLNNTGNQNITEGQITINATNLIGETTSSQALHSGNFTASNNTVGTNECDISGATGLAQQMNTVSGANFVSVNGTITAGNFTISDGTAQEQLYVCLWLAGNEISQQSYSTASAGAWTIQIIWILPLLNKFLKLLETLFVLKILLAVISTKRKKKIKEKNNSKLKDDKLVKAMSLIMEELQEKHSLGKAEAMNFIIDLSDKYKLSKKEIIEMLELKQKENIPSNIFNKKLGALESVVKYMKENLNMSYKEIAEALNRNQRTIWTSYNKAKGKMQEELQTKESKFFFPIEIFKNRTFTVLESLILHLKEKGLKIKEISNILDRDPRNIQTIYSRSIKKIKDSIDKRNI